MRAAGLPAKISPGNGEAATPSGFDNSITMIKQKISLRA
jgi:hypothetical protein